MKYHLLLLSFLILLPLTAKASPFAWWDERKLVLDNGMVQRIIELPAVTGNFITSSYTPGTAEKMNYFSGRNADFRFEANGVIYSGEGKWSISGIKEISDSFQGNGAAVTLLSEDKKIELTLSFLLYPEMPVIRKKLNITNRGEDKILLESVDVERFTTTGYFSTTFSTIHSDYGRRESIGPYEGNLQDALVIIHNPEWNQGIIIGNEAPGVCKRTAFCWDDEDIVSGLSHKTALFPFGKWLDKDESFETPQVFTMVYKGKSPEEMLNTAVPDFVRKHMGIRLSLSGHKPTFVYNTWEPFRKDIDEKLIMELAKAAADAGMKEFIIDDGWQDSYGDWGIDRKKFPNGLKPVFDYIKSLGMKPGIWVSIGTAAPDSRVYQQHPEWFVEDANGKPVNLITNENDKYTACFGTGWYEYIKGVLTKLLVEHGIEYLKLDFSIVTSPYVFDHHKSGCYATHHHGHTGHRESLYNNYEYMWKLFDELHEIQPQLFIDCTFETMGGLQLIDYAMLKHAEGNWLSNFYGSNEKNDWRVRKFAWWRSPAMPATALVIGNPEMQDEGWEMHIKSLAGALPIMLGDPRKLSPADLEKYRWYADWLQRMEKEYQIMSFRQDLYGFGEPQEGFWDGFQRINTDTCYGGIIGVFRHGAKDSLRNVYISYLDPVKTYRVTTMEGKEITMMKGRELNSKGFAVILPELYSGELFEVKRID